MRLLSDKVCVLMATEMEASELIKESVNALESETPFLIYRNAEFNLLITGIGKINAKLATVWALSQGAEKFINAGICGCLNDQLALFQVCCPSSIKDLDLMQCGAKEIYCDQKENLCIGTVSKPLHGGQERQNFQIYCDLVDMEAYGIASALEMGKNTLKMIKCITDFCQLDGSIEIKKNLPQASLLLQAAVHLCEK